MHLLFGIYLNLPLERIIRYFRYNPCFKFFIWSSTVALSNCFSCRQYVLFGYLVCQLERGAYSTRSAIALFPRGLRTERGSDNRLETIFRLSMLFLH